MTQARQDAARMEPWRANQAGASLANRRANPVAVRSTLRLEPDARVGRRGRYLNPKWPPPNSPSRPMTIR